jgi:hypothetical protein
MAKKTVSQIEKETDERRTLNVQHRTSNECILSVLKKMRTVGFICQAGLA